MSVGWQIAFGVALIAGGSAGYERQMSLDSHGWAVFETCVILVGMFILATAIDGVLP